MNYSNKETLLEMVELYANSQGYIESEQGLSDDFDMFLNDIEYEYNDDNIEVREMFAGWADSLCKEGEIHTEQYNNYCYVGIYK